MSPHPTPCHHRPRHVGACTLVLPQDVCAPRHPGDLPVPVPQPLVCDDPHTSLTLGAVLSLVSAPPFSRGPVPPLCGGSLALTASALPNPPFPPAPQMALRNCSAVADTHCGCRPGWFMDCMVSQCRHGSPFRCHPCTDCGALHRHTQTPCSSRDTHCGTCLPGFYEYGKSCVSCPTSTLGSCPEPCVAVCGWRQMFWVQMLVAGLVVPLLLGATLTYTYRRCHPCKPMGPTDDTGVEVLTPLQTTNLSPPDSGPALLVPPSSSEKVCPVQLVGHGWTSGSPQTQEAPCPEATWSWDQLPSRAPGPSPPLSPAPPAGSAAATLQPGPQLYDVMDAVPARRWKEFVRTLGLREAEIEAVEVEVGRFRDQQYEMLKRWRQQQHAGLGAVYAALERMGLDGCAEDLRSRLQRGP
ncbi:tumor necrosis factor receptor superfamily member 25 isoform X3 [Cervus elaphus]|uniref:tumor necrosis factor receptor superfamily member 25 isoform X3 n=1 Tax=Cervus elaphus TaxID=9860 RepID=UPI001CC299B8|nr:tumor necrosis factor receptor superfamily member 25 isoform X3 [Cervus elaphus]